MPPRPARGVKVSGGGWLRVSESQGYLYGVPSKEDYSILGSILASSYLRKSVPEEISFVLKPRWVPSEGM